MFVKKVEHLVIEMVSVSIDTEWSKLIRTQPETAIQAPSQPSNSSTPSEIVTSPGLATTAAGAAGALASFAFTSLTRKVGLDLNELHSVNCNVFLTAGTWRPTSSDRTSKLYTAVYQRYYYCFAPNSVSAPRQSKAVHTRRTWGSKIFTGRVGQFGRRCWRLER